MRIQKFVPIILVAAAIIGVVFQYQTYQKLTGKKPCNCQEGGAGPLPD
jgi:uncharacterized membrane protein (DUF106 family)